MFSVMTWNLENFEQPAVNAEQAAKDRYAHKLQQITELITSSGPDLVGVQDSRPARPTRWPAPVPARRIRVARSVLAPPPHITGACAIPFEPEDPTTPDRPDLH